MAKPKFLQFSLIKALAGILAFQCNKQIYYLFFYILIISEKQDSSTKCKSRGEKLFSKSRHMFGIKKMFEERSGYGMV